MAFIFEYLWQIVVALGGSVVTIVIALVKWRRGEEVDEDVFWPTVGAVIVALIGIALQERSGRMEAVEALQGHEVATRPKLRPTIENVAFQLTPRGTDMFVQLKVIGQGSDTIADGYVLKISTARGGIGKVKPRNIEPPTTEVFRKLGIEPAASILEKTTATPITRGSQVRGWLRYPINGDTPEGILGRAASSRSSCRTVRRQPNPDRWAS